MRSKILLAVIFLLNTTIGFAQDNKAKADYLAKNSATWNDNFKNIDRVFTPEILKNQHFMIDEGHGIAYSYNIRYDRVNYLRQKAGVKYLFMELGYLDGIVLNEYLRTGDDATYTAAFEKYNGTYYNAGYIMMPKGKSDTTNTSNKYKRVANTYDYFTGSFTYGDLLGKYNKSGKAVLFNLTATGTPFKGQKSFLIDKDHYANVDEMFQLLILINDSPAAGGMDRD